MIKPLVHIFFIMLFSSLGNLAFSEISITPKDSFLIQEGLVTQLQEHIQIQEGNNRIGYIEIADRSSSISQATWLYVKSAIDFYKKNKPDFILLKLNTPGGEVFASQKIGDALKELDVQLGIPTVAYIDNWAISAGALIAYSCRFIVATEDASMGAAEPVLVGESGEMKSASEKVNSAIRTDFANRARFFGRNPDIAEAMVDKDLILVERNGKVIRLDSEDEIIKTGDAKDKIISAKGKLLTLSAEEMFRFGVADIVLKSRKLNAITEDEKRAGVWAFSKELLSEAPFFKEIPNAFIHAYRMDWKTQFFYILASPMVASLLMLGLIVGFYLEFTTPGFGFPGTLALTCLILIILSSFSLEIASSLELILLVAGIVLFILEFALLPTGGLLAFIGALFFLGGLLGLLLPGIGGVDYEFDTNTFNAAGEAVMSKLGLFSATLIASFAIIALISRFITPRLMGVSKFVLQGHEQDAKNGYVAGIDPLTLPKLGERGKVLSTLRPAGKIQIGEKIFDAMTTGTYIEKGESIVIERVDGNILYVARED